MQHKLFPEERKSATTAVVVLSGGQDSITCLAAACADHANVKAISFDYGQRHGVELECAMSICNKWNIDHRIVDLSMMRKLVTSALLNPAMNVGDSHPRMQNLPASFVPVRNALFLTLAHGYAQEVGATAVYGGMCQTDYSGYPDCREGFIDLLGAALNLGYESKIIILTPLMNLTKAETFAFADHLGVLADVIEHSHTCYNGSRETRHAWGYGCGECPACKIRARGYDEFTTQRQGERA